MQEASSNVPQEDRHCCSTREERKYINTREINEFSQQGARENISEKTIYNAVSQQVAWKDFLKCVPCDQSLHVNPNNAHRGHLNLYSQ